MSSGTGLEGISPDELNDCLQYGRTGTAIIYACAALYFYDYCLTFYDETQYIWRPRRISLTSVTYCLARYPAFATAVLVLLPDFNTNGPNTLLLSQIVTGLRLLSIISSEFILAVRTWAIWEKRRAILILLTVFSVAAVVPAAVVVAKDIMTSKTDPIMNIFPDCRIIISEVTDAYVVPYVLAITYEGITLTLSLIRITRWRRRIPERVRAPLLDTLSRDGVFYFSWTLALSIMNIVMIVQSTSDQFRSGSSELQAVLHSMLSCRVVLHLAGSRVPKDINSSGCSLYTNPSIQFTTQIGFTVDEMPSQESGINTLDIEPQHEHDEDAMGQDHDRIPLEGRTPPLPALGGPRV